MNDCPRKDARCKQSMGADKEVNQSRQLCFEGQKT